VNTTGLTTKERILEAAAHVFGQQGFKAATIRQICWLADANIASVNYYFKDKEGLYAAVIEELMSTGIRNYPADMGLEPDASPGERLGAFVQAILCRLLSEDGWAGSEGKGQLIAKELADPSPTLDWIVEQYIHPQKELLTAIISDLLGPEASPDLILSCALSVIGQCLYYGYARPILDRIAPGHVTPDTDIEKLAAHITTFSLAGIDALRHRNPGPGSPEPQHRTFAHEVTR